MKSLSSFYLIVALAAVVFVSMVASPWTALSQEKTANEIDRSAHVIKHDLAKYAADAMKWDQEVAKLVASNSSDGGDDAILCLGSSSFRLWDSISVDMAPYQMLRRAYGGAKFCDLAIHSPKLVDGIRFRAAMIFVGNDITGKEKDKTPVEIARLAKIVIDSVREHRSEVPIFVIAITPTPSRFQHWQKIVLANDALEKLVAAERNTFFVATQDRYLNSQGAPRPELFVKDMLHQNKEGYAIWSRLLKNSLEKNLR